MRSINKGQEPVQLTKWRANKAGSSWDEFHKKGQKTYARVRDSLREEQGALCCYCNARLEPDDCHIDHLRPKSRFRQHTYEYDNMLLSCQKHGREHVPKHCGVKKGEWFHEQLTVHPLLPDCAEHFDFLSSGEIRPAPNATPDQQRAAKETIDHLALDIDPLRKRRRSIIDAHLRTGRDLLDEPRARKLYQVLSLPGRDGQYEPYCSAVLAVLRKLYPHIDAQP